MVILGEVALILSGVALGSAITNLSWVKHNERKEAIRKLFSTKKDTEGNAQLDLTREQKDRLALAYCMLNTNRWCVDVLGEEPKDYERNSYEYWKKIAPVFEQMLGHAYLNRYWNVCFRDDPMDENEWFSWRLTRGASEMISKAKETKQADETQIKE